MGDYQAGIWGPHPRCGVLPVLLVMGVVGWVAAKTPVTRPMDSARLRVLDATVALGVALGVALDVALGHSNTGFYGHFSA